MARFEARHALGSKARLALALLLWTGTRRSDLVGLGRQHARAGWLEFTQAKNRNRRPVRIEIPILPQLQEVLEASPTGDLTYLVTEAGRPFSVAGFGNWFAPAATRRASSTAPPTACAKPARRRLPRTAQPRNS